MEASLRQLPSLRARSSHYRGHEAPDYRQELCHGLYAATSDVGRVGRWWGRWARANIGARVPASLLGRDTATSCTH